MTEFNPNLLITFIACTTACTGFALWFKVKGIQVFYAACGACCTWGVYTLVMAWLGNDFMATVAGAIFVAAYAQVMARVNKAPATIFQSVCAFPLIPGNNLYFVMYALVMGMPKYVRSEGKMLLLCCLGIALGFFIVEVANKYLVLLYRFLRRRGQRDRERTAR